MKKTTVFFAAVVSILIASISAFPQQAGSSASLPDIQKRISELLISSGTVSYISQEKTKFVSGGPEYRAHSDRSKISGVEFAGCRMTFGVRSRSGETLVSMNASMNDPNDRQALGVPAYDPKLFPMTRSMRISFDLAYVDTEMAGVADGAVMFKFAGKADSKPIEITLDAA